MELKLIARIRTDFPEKFGIPRQSGLVEGLTGRVVFEPEFRTPDALRGIRDYDRIWLIWGFDRAVKQNWSATVRPPRLGGNQRVGVFATRSPFRPNAIGLSCVKLTGVEDTAEGPVLLVSGIDMMDGTPIYDIKPYLPFADAFPDAKAGFSDAVREYSLQVEAPEELLAPVPEDKRQALIELLQNDPRPSYQTDPDRIYGFSFAGCEVKFRVQDGTLYVTGVE